MPLYFDLNEGVGVFRTVGDVEFEEGLRVLEAGLEAIRSADGRNLVLFDIRQSTENRTHDELRGIAGVTQHQLGKGQLALVVGSELYYGLSRVFAAYAERDGLMAEVFLDMDAALQWLRFGVASESTGDASKHELT